MRIISGKYKGRVIKTPKGIRPTGDKVRKALFDILGEVGGLSFLELFAGSGAVGIEALSQGAGKVVLVENNPQCVTIIRGNLSSLKSSNFEVLVQDVVKAIKELYRQGPKFDIIFLDPPYYKGEVPRRGPYERSRPCSGSMGGKENEPLTKKTLQILTHYDILTHAGLVIVQHFKKDILPEKINNLIVFKQASYGDTVLSFYKKI